MAEVIFPSLPGAAAVKLRRNLFQNLTEGSTAWASSGGRAFSKTMNATEMADLERLFQQRHLLEHRDGFVDQPYLDRTADSDYGVGARIVIKEASVKRLADLIEKLGAALRADLP